MYIHLFQRALSRSQNADRTQRQGKSSQSRNRNRGDFDPGYDEFEDLVDPKGAFKRLSAHQVSLVTRSFRLRLCLFVITANPFARTVNERCGRW